MSKASFRFIRSWRTTGSSSLFVTTVVGTGCTWLRNVLCALYILQHGYSIYLVLSELAGHVLLGSLQSILQVSAPGLGLLHHQLPTFLCLGQVILQAHTLEQIKHPCNLHTRLHSSLDVLVNGVDYRLIVPPILV